MPEQHPDLPFTISLRDDLKPSPLTLTEVEGTFNLEGHVRGQLDKVLLEQSERPFLFGSDLTITKVEGPDDDKTYFQWERDLKFGDYSVRPLSFNFQHKVTFEGDEADDYKRLYYGCDWGVKPPTVPPYARGRPSALAEEEE